MVVVLYLYMWTANKKRDREAVVSRSQLTAEQEKEAIERGMQVCTLLNLQNAYHLSTHLIPSFWCPQPCLFYLRCFDWGPVVNKYFRM